MIDRLRALALVLPLLVCSAALAQATSETNSTASSHERARAETAFLEDQLQLPAAQEKQALAINLDHARGTQKLFTASTSSRYRAQRLQELELEREQKLKKVLSGDQYRAYLAARSAMRQRGFGITPPSPAKPAEP